MEFHTINGVLHAMPDTVRAHNAVEDWLKDPDGTVARLASLDRVAAHEFRASRLEARARFEEKRRKLERQGDADPQVAALRAEAETQRKAAADALERLNKALAESPTDAPRAVRSPKPAKEN